MSVPKTVGLPRMMKEAGEKRVFLPEFVQFLAELGARVYIEEGYGSRSGYTFDHFHQGNEAVRMCSRQEAYQKDLVLVLRSPLREEYNLLRKGSCLMSMLHYPTRHRRVDELLKLGVNAISLDSIVNDQNIRLVENMKAVAWNGLEAAFNVLEKEWRGIKPPDNRVVQVLVLGTGMVGKHAVDAATKMGNIERNNLHIEKKGNGVICLVAGRNLSCYPESIQRFFQSSDILVDATQRRDTSSPVVPNSWIKWLPDHAVIADLAVDPYTLDTDPPVVRGLEGIPQGDLNQFVFYPDDPNWDKSVPGSVPSKNRRCTVSCYSWPGIHPAACMTHYAQQLEPLMKALFVKGYDGLSIQGEYFERALYRATLRSWIQDGHYRPRPR